MLVQFHGSLNSYRLECRITWRLPAARSFSEAEITVPRSSPAFSPDYIDADGGFLVTIQHGELGYFSGIVDRVSISREGAKLHAWEIAQMATRRVVSTRTPFQALPAGAIVKQALLDATAGLSHGSLLPGTFVEAPPVIQSYEFRGQTFAEVLGAMQAASGQEWSVSTAGVFSWHAPRGTLYDGVLADSGDLGDGMRSADRGEQAAEVRARGSDGRELRAVAPEVYAGTFWDRVVVASASTDSMQVLGALAQQQLDALRGTPTTFTFTVRRQGIGGAYYGVGLYGSSYYYPGPSAWAQIREGDLLRAVLPWAGFTGACPLLRVLSRSYADGDPALAVEVQAIDPFDSATAAVAAARPVPPPVVPVSTDFIRLALAEHAKVNQLLAGS